MATLDPEFDRRLRGLLTGARSAGQSLSVTSGYRSAEDQRRAIDSVSRNVLGRPASFMEYARGIKGYAAPVGGSMHQRGLAADLAGGGLGWAHANAANYGLRFPPALAKTDPIHLEIDPKAMGPFQDPRDMEGVNPVAVPASKGGVVSAAVGAAPGSFRAAQEVPPTPTSTVAPAVASYASSGAPSMAMPPSNGWTPESVESSRRIARALMGQGLDSSPVGHWTQALARVLQTGVGTAWDSQANVAEREGKKQVGDYMAANAGASPQQFAAGLTQNPFSADIGQRMMMQNMQRAPELEMQRERLKLEQQNAARQGALTAAQLQQIKNQSPEWRQANAARFGIDVTTDSGKRWVVSGDYAAPNANASQNITWGRDAAGNWVPMQATRSGELVPSKLPANVQPVPVPELAEAKAAATERGQGLGKAQVDLPAVEMNADLINKTLDQVQQAIDENPRMVGALTSRLPNITADANRAQSIIDQTSGKVFLQAYAGLRGGGAITEAEGAKAEASLSRLRTTAVGTRAYTEAINDVRREIAALVEVARKKARAGRQPAASSAPASGVPQSRPRAVNPSTGQAVEFDGSQWVPVQ